MLKVEEIHGYLFKIPFLEHCNCSTQSEQLANGPKFISMCITSFDYVWWQTPAQRQLIALQPSVSVARGVLVGKTQTLPWRHCFNRMSSWWSSRCVVFLWNLTCVTPGKNMSGVQSKFCKWPWWTNFSKIFSLTLQLIPSLSTEDFLY